MRYIVKHFVMLFICSMMLFISFACSRELDDSEVETIRDLMYQLAFVVVGDYQNKCNKVVPITAERNKNEKR